MLLGIGLVGELLGFGGGVEVAVEGGMGPVMEAVEEREDVGIVEVSMGFWGWTSSSMFAQL